MFFQDIFRSSKIEYTKFILLSILLHEIVTKISRRSIQRQNYDTFAVHVFYASSKSHDYKILTSSKSWKIAECFVKKIIAFLQLFFKLWFLNVQPFRWTYGNLRTLYKWEKIATSTRTKKILKLEFFFKWILSYFLIYNFVNIQY